MTPTGEKFTLDDVNVRPIAYVVTIWPDTVHCMDAALWCVTVADMSYGNWAVLRGACPGAGDPGERQIPVLGRDRQWHREKRPSERTEAEIRDHRFSYDEAMAPRVEINGMTAMEAVIRHSLKERCHACEGPYTA